MLEIKECECCKKVFSSKWDFPICNKCINMLKEKIENYTNNNNEASKEEIISNTGISNKLINICKKYKIVPLPDDIEVCESNNCYKDKEFGKKYCKDCLKNRKAIMELSSLYEEKTLDDYKNEYSRLRRR